MWKKVRIFLLAARRAMLTPAPITPILTISPPTDGYATNQAINILGTLKLAGNDYPDTQELDIDLKAFIENPMNIDADIALIEGGYNNANLLLTEPMYVNSILVTRNSDNAQYSPWHSGYSDLFDARRLGCSTCQNLILSAVPLSFNVYPILAADDILTLHITGTDTAGEDISLTQEITVKSHIHQSPLVNP